MHLHFVQSLEALQGAGLGQSALSLHLAMDRTHPLPATRDSLPSSILLSTRAADFDCTWSGVIQGVRRRPGKAFYAPELKRLAAEAIGEAEWFHGHGLYVWLNMWLGGEARRRGKPLVYHPQGFFDPWILQRSRGKKRIAHWLFEDKNMAYVRWWRAVSSKEADQIRAVVGPHAVVHVIPNGVDINEVDGVTGNGLLVTGERMECAGDGEKVGKWESGKVISRQSSVGSGEAWSGEHGAGSGRQGTGDGGGEVTSNGLLVTGERTENRGEGTKTCHTPQVTRHSAWAERKRPKRLLFLSRIHSKKGLDMLVPAWGKLTQEFPDWELLIVGPDEGGYQATVEKMIFDAGCGETCWIHSAVSGAEKHALLRTADLFVLPSYSEGFPMAVLEAAAHRIPVVQTVECNFPELAAEGGAWECRPEIQAVEQALREALSADDSERAERGKHGRALIEKSYSWDSIAGVVREICGQ